MNIGFGLYRHMLTPDNYAFARQAGATHLVVHLVDYFTGRSFDTHLGGAVDDQPVGSPDGWGPAGDPGRLWTLPDLLQIKREIESAGLTWYAIENFDPAHWHDVLWDGPMREQQVSDLKEMVRAVGEAGIPVIGYNFSLAGIHGRIPGPWARGGAESVGLFGEVNQDPIPNGMAWNMTYDASALGSRATVTREQLWERWGRFLDELLPVAEEAGVALAAHPDDPPVETLRSQPRLIHQKTSYQRLIDLNPSPANRLEFCLGTLAEMADGNLYDTIAHYVSQKRVAYVHCRNVRGRVPDYVETFIDDGDIDFNRVMEVLNDHDFDGVLIPDHAPRMTCDAPWHAGMAFAMGFIASAVRQAARSAT